MCCTVEHLRSNTMFDPVNQLRDGALWKRSMWLSRVDAAVAGTGHLKVAVKFLDLGVV